MRTSRRENKNVNQLIDIPRNIHKKDAGGLSPASFNILISDKSVNVKIPTYTFLHFFSAASNKSSRLDQSKLFFHQLTFVSDLNISFG